MVKLDEQEERWLSGADGQAMQLAMRLIAGAAEVSEASEFVRIEFAHINSCHYSGQMSLDFAEFLLAEGATLAVPTHTNASLIDCSVPSLRPEVSDPVAVAGAKRLMEIYEELGCSTMWTCAPYQELDGRPGLGQQIAGSESNAVSFFNAVLGARTNKYGDLLDMAAAMTGRVPLAGLHTDEGRRATQVFRLDDVSDAVRRDPTFPHLVGVLVGQRAGHAVPAITGIDAAAEDELKAIAAAAASSGSVEMFHVVGVTPEAETLNQACGGIAPVSETTVTDMMLTSIRDALSTRESGPVNAVCLGTPHFSIQEFDELRTALNSRAIHPNVAMLVTTSRAVEAELQLRGWTTQFRDAGVQLILDTCTYYTPVASGVRGLVMTNSAKWAYYAPGILNVEVAFASLSTCVESAIAGEVRP